MSSLAPPDLLAGPVGPLIRRLAWPAVIGLSANAIHQTVNAVFLGHLGPEALGAVTLTLPLIAAVAAFGEGVGVAAATGISRHLGANDRRAAGALAGLALASLFPLSLASWLLLHIWGDKLLLVIGANSAALPLARSYLAILAPALGLTLMQVVCDFIAIGEGNSRFSMLTLLGGFALNVALDPILIFWLGLGVPGAALATVISQTLVLGAYFWYFRVGGGLKLGRLNWIDLRQLGSLITIGLPVTASSLLAALAFAWVSSAASSTAGLEGVAAIGIALRLMLLGTLPLAGLALGAQPLLGAAHGAGLPDRLSAISRAMLVSSSLFAIFYGLGVAALAEPIARLFTDDAKVLALAIPALVSIHLAFPLAGLRLVTLVLAQVLDRPRLAALIALAPQGYLLIPPLALLPQLYGFAAVGWSLAGALAISGLIAAVLLPALLSVGQRHAFPGSTP